MIFIANMHGFLFQKIKTDNAFQNNIDESNRKPSKIWVNKASEFCNRSVKSRLKGNDTEMYSIHDKGESVVTERFIRPLKNKIY